MVALANEFAVSEVDRFAVRASGAFPGVLGVSRHGGGSADAGRCSGARSQRIGGVDG
jgi:hypothetical protein